MFKKNLLYSEKEIKTKVKEIAKKITKDYENVLKENEQLLVIGVLNGAFIFMADLVRELNLPLEVDFVRLSSYQMGATSSAKVIMTKSIEKDIEGRHILIVEDIADGGLTLLWLIDFLQKRKPASVKTVVAIDKLGRREKDILVDYKCFTLEDGFLVGYGLDYAERDRALKDIYDVIL